MSKFKGESLFMTIFLISAYASIALAGEETSEIQRIQSPDHSIDIVVTQYAADATVSTPYEIFLVPSGAMPDAEQLIFKVDKSDLPVVAWDSNTSISIKCDRSRIWHFQNFTSLALTKKEVFVNVAIRLECGNLGYSDH